MSDDLTAKMQAAAPMSDRPPPMPTCRFCGRMCFYRGGGCPERLAWIQERTDAGALTVEGTVETAGVVIAALRAEVTALRAELAEAQAETKLQKEALSAAVSATKATAKAARNTRVMADTNAKVNAAHQWAENQRLTAALAEARNTIEAQAALIRRVLGGGDCGAGQWCPVETCVCCLPFHASPDVYDEPFKSQLASILAAASVLPTGDES